MDTHEESFAGQIGSYRCFYGFVLQLTDMD
jgi:hypothetical protein